MASHIVYLCKPMVKRHYRNGIILSPYEEVKLAKVLKTQKSRQVGSVRVSAVVV